VDCRVTVVVAADVEETWRAWTDVGLWPEWNPACEDAEVEEPLRVGSRMDLRLVHPKGRPFFTRPSVTVLDHGERLGWSARSLGLAADTLVELTPEEDGTRVTLTASSSGALGFTYRLIMRPKTQARMYATMLDGLAARYRP
jgi:uncharacterized protein YndB with AHSA1/START domain